MIQQQQKHLMSHMMENQFPNLNTLPKYVGHLFQRPNVQHQNSNQVPTTFGCSHACDSNSDLKAQKLFIMNLEV